MIEIPPTGYGAVEKHVWELSRALKARGHSVTILNEVVGPSGRAEYRWARRARVRLRSERADIVHVHTTGVAATFAALGPPFVYTSHSRHWLDEGDVEAGVPPNKLAWNERLGFALERYAVKRAREVVALTEDVANAMRRRSAARPRVIPNGVDADAYRAAWESRTGRTVLCLGAIQRHKGFHVAALAASGVPGLEVRVVGPLKDVAYADELERAGARVLGPVAPDELARELAQADILAHPSTSEAFSLAVLEGMAAALPLVASDLCKGQVFEGENGFAIPSRANEEERIAATRRAFERLVADASLRRRFGERSRALVLERYTWDRVASEVEAVYRAALASNLQP